MCKEGLNGLDVGINVKNPHPENFPHRGLVNIKCIPRLLRVALHSYKRDVIATVSHHPKNKRKVGLSPCGYTQKGLLVTEKSQNDDGLFTWMHGIKTRLWRICKLAWAAKEHASADYQSRDQGR